jgi:hypothetical protein
VASKAVSDVVRRRGARRRWQNVPLGTVDTPPVTCRWRDSWTRRILALVTRISCATAAVAAWLSIATFGCRNAAVVPDTPLGRVAADWLAAHNRGEGHAAVHYTLTHQGELRMSGAQVDSVVYASVKFAQAVGPFVLVRLLESSDTALALLLRSGSSGNFTARFKPARQPAMLQVAVQIDRVEP